MGTASDQRGCEFAAPSPHPATIYLAAVRSFTSDRAGKPVEVFEAARVERMLRSGQSADAEHYLERFLPPIPIRDRSPLSILLRFHVRVFRIISKVAAGGPSGAKMAALFANPSEYISTYAPEPLQRWMCGVKERHWGMHDAVEHVLEELF